MKGSAIIEVWNKAKVELEDLLSGMRNEHYVGNILARHGFIVRNSIFDSCWFSKNGVSLHIKRDCDTEKWVLTEYIGLRGEATWVRYIKEEKEYELDKNQK